MFLRGILYILRLTTFKYCEWRGVLMIQVNFDNMNDAELRQYFLANRQDQAALQAYLDKFN